LIEGVWVARSVCCSNSVVYKAIEFYLEGKDSTSTAAESITFTVLVLLMMLSSSYWTLEHLHTNGILAINLSLYYQICFLPLRTGKRPIISEKCESVFMLGALRQVERCIYCAQLVFSGITRQLQKYIQPKSSIFNFHCEVMNTPYPQCMRYVRNCKVIGGCVYIIALIM
jgi:hypothetical protein